MDVQLLAKRTERQRRILKERARAQLILQRKLGPWVELYRRAERLRRWNELLSAIVAVYVGVEISRGMGWSGSLGEMIAAWFK